VSTRTNILASVDFGKIVGLNKIAESMQWTDLATSQIAQIAQYI
jgi:hypothetical protein